jgi:ATP-binding cassette subfamily B protein
MPGRDPFEAGRRLSRRRVRTTTVLQYDVVECGAASLKIVLAYLGRVVPLAELRERCGISRDGVTALQLKRAAEGLGLQVRAYRSSASQLRGNGQFPAILYWNFNHFLVLEGFARDRAFLSDPACGRLSVDWEEFQTSFTGVVLELQPGEAFRRGGREPGLYRWLPRLLAPYGSILAWLAMVSLVLALPELFIAGATSQMIDAVLEQGRIAMALPLIWIAVLACAVMLALLYLQKLLLRRLADGLLLRLSSMLYVSLFSLPYRYFLQRMRGELSSRLLLPFSLVQQGVSGVIDFLLTLGSAGVALLVGLFISPLLSLLTVAISAANAALTLWIRDRRKGDNYRLAVAQGKAQGVGMYVIQSMESIKASGLENEAFTQWATGFNEALEEQQKQAVAASAVGLIGITSGFLLRCGVILVGGLLIILGRLTLGELMAFQFLMGMIQAPLQQLTMLSSQMQQFDGEFGRVNDVIDTDIDPMVRSFAAAAAAPLDASPRQLRGELQLQQLGFRFASSTPMLFDGLDLSLGAGRHLAIVGGSGSGKSTLLRLIAGLNPASQGRILYDGRPWLAWDDATLRASLGLVAQDVFLFPATLEQNLTLWDPRFSRADALEALEQAGLLEDLGGAAALGLQLGEGGGNLSGGQRQRVEIARALLRRPTLLLMDEATSALDARLEQQVMAAVKRTACTLITVAHRLHAARISDQVLVLDQGRPVQLGPPAELADQQGPFRLLLEAELSHSGGGIS